ncbi:MAG TPA: SDR family NAD(P)-dependent oxidoreductase, partial [Cryomorphaceae bacterium]|nr:SDR family NAD(P)-dependent oxidoreductase [Cryomorphaceae bacterium]
MTDTKNKVAVVTGANRGIGFEIARQLGFKGYTVYACGRDENSLNQSVGMLTGEGHRVFPVVLDVRDPESIKSMREKLSDDEVRIDALVNNAAVLVDRNKSILELSRSEVMETLETNTIAPLMVTQALSDLLSEGSRVVMVSSTSGKFCAELEYWAPIYATSKTALNAITRQMAPELAKRNISINAVHPGWVKTDMGGDGAQKDVPK